MINSEFMVEENVSASANARQFLSEGLFIAILPIYAYTLSFLFELGISNYFGFPVFLIEVNIKTVLVAATTMAVVTIFPAMLVFSFHWLVPGIDPEHTIVIRLKRLSVIIFIVVLYFLIRADYKYWMLGFLVFMAANEFLIPLLTERNVKGYLAKLAQDGVKDAKVDIPLRRIERKIGFGRFFLVILAVVLLTTAFAVGESYAKHSSWFITVEDLVILRNYGDYFICARLISEKGEIAPGFILLAHDEVARNGSVLLDKKIGPLIIKKGQAISDSQKEKQSKTTQKKVK